MLCNGPDTPLKVHLVTRASAPPCNTWHPGLTQLSIAYSISIGSAVFAQLTEEGPNTLQWVALFSPQNCPFWRGSEWITNGSFSIRSAVFFAGLTTVTRACERSGIAVENGVERAENWLSGSEAVSERARKPWSGSTVKTGRVTERERTGEWTKLAAQISLKGNASLFKLCESILPITLDSVTTTTTVLWPFSRITRVSWCQNGTSGLYGARAD